MISAQMLSDSSSTLNSRKGLPHFFEKLRGGDSVVIAYLGGSITAAAGYRVQTEAKIKELYPKAAVGGTGSPLGVFRVDNEVLKYNPDLVFVEFAVNDASTDSLAVLRSMEGIVRKIKLHNLKTDVCFLYTINEPMLKAFKQKRLASSVSYMEQVASHYGIPSINLGFDVYHLLLQNKLVFKADKETDSLGRIMFTKDRTHPTIEGHKIYTQTIMSSLDRLKLVKQEPNTYHLPNPLIKDNYKNAMAYPPMKFKITAGWKGSNSQPFLDRFSSDLPGLIYTDNPNDSLVIRFKGNFFGIEDILGPTSSSVNIIVDGKEAIEKLRFDKSSTYYRRSYFYMDGLGDGEHTVIIKPTVNNDEKLKVLKAIHKDKDKKYSSNYTYIGHILLSKAPNQ